MACGVSGTSQVRVPHGVGSAQGWWATHCHWWLLTQWWEVRLKRVAHRQAWICISPYNCIKRRRNLAFKNCPIAEARTVKPLKLDVSLAPLKAAFHAEYKCWRKLTSEYCRCIRWSAPPYSTSERCTAIWTSCSSSSMVPKCAGEFSSEK